MLTELRIQNFAIIDDLQLSLEPGFVVLTGETGAGKSIIIDAVEMLLGGRADSTAIRSAADVALIEGHFTIDEDIQSDVHKILERENLMDDPRYLVLSREIRREGRNVARVNGRVTTLSLLGELGDWLVDVHGQSEHLSLRRVAEHVHLLDRYAKLDDLRSRYQQAYAQLRRVRAELETLRTNEREAQSRSDYLTFQIDEIEAAQLNVDEEQDLREERTRLANTEQLTRLSAEVVATLAGGVNSRDAAMDQLGRAVDALTELAEIDESMKPLGDRAQALMEDIADLSRTLRRYQEEVDFNPKRLNEVEDRLNLIQSLKRKYGGSIEAVLRQAELARQEMDSITHAEQRIEKLQFEEQGLLEQLAKLGVELSEARTRAGEELSSAIEAHLDDLRMAEAEFDLNLVQQEASDGVPVEGKRLAFYPTGIDQVEFLVAPNPGEGLKPLAKIASGGETSRLMLGLKSVLAQADRTPTLIFDEIDQGIGGRVGTIVGQKLWALSVAHQVLCITHLPQLAAFGDQHVKVEKQVKDGRTITTTRSLDDPERAKELATMIGAMTESNLESALGFLESARDEKASRIAPQPSD
ncbi:MAG: DNA repair protein RecN [Anaerolineales bacterium]|jgi:DNA repair protein RecN (Recombination protein N)